MRRFIGLLSLSVLFSGCVSGPQKEVHEKYCVNQGHIKESPDFLQCVETRMAAEEKAREEHRHTERRKRNAKKHASQPGQRLLEW